MVDQIHKKNLGETIIQIVKFNAVGAANTAITYGIYSAFIALGAHHLVALFFDYAFGMAISFFLNKRLTFQVKESTTPLMVVRMVFTYIPIIIVNALALSAFVDLLGMNKYLSQAICLVGVAFLSFLAQRFFVFKKRENHGV